MPPNGGYYVFPAAPGHQPIAMPCNPPRRYRDGRADVWGYADPLGPFRGSSFPPQPAPFALVPENNGKCDPVTGLPIPPTRTRKRPPPSASQSAATSKRKRDARLKIAMANLKTKNDTRFNAITMIALEDGRVYDTCDEVRAKADAYVKKHKCSRQSLLRALCVKNPVKPELWKQFMTKTGEFSGANIRSYYLGYYFFEKIRFCDNGHKTKARVESETNFPEGRPFTHDFVEDTNDPTACVAFPIVDGEYFDEDEDIGFKEAEAAPKEAEAAPKKAEAAPKEAEAAPKEAEAAPKEAEAAPTLRITEAVPEVAPEAIEKVDEATAAAYKTDGYGGSTYGRSNSKVDL